MAEKNTRGVLGVLTGRGGSLAGILTSREGMATRGEAWTSVTGANRPRQARLSGAGRSDHAESRMLDAIQRDAFGYFLHETNRANGLVLDKTCADWPASIAAVGLALTAYPVGVERGFVPRAEAAERTLTTLRFFWRSKQGPEPDATGYKGFYYHFLDLQTRRARLAVRAVDGRLRPVAGRHADGRGVLRRRRAGRARDPRPRRSAVRARRLAMGPERRRHGDARMEAGERIPAVPLGRL